MKGRITDPSRHDLSCLPLTLSKTSNKENKDMTLLDLVRILRPVLDIVRQEPAINDYFWRITSEAHEIFSDCQFRHFVFKVGMNCCYDNPGFEFA